MGGNALKQFNTVRLSSNEVELYGSQIVERLSKYGTASIIPSYRNKETHGDLDILINCEIPTYHLENIIFNVSPHPTPRIHQVSNGSARSLGLQLTEDSIFQVDFIYANPVIYDFSLAYFSYNDCGNLIGVTAHKTGLKFGHQGLQYVIRDNTYVVGTIDVDLNFESALSFLGFDYDAWKDGFDSLEDIFKWVSSSKYFHPSYYPLEHRNHTSRVRDKKRPTYNAFLTWLQSNPVNHGLLFTKDEWLEKIFNHYPQAKIDYDNIIANRVKNNLLHEKFNGMLVQEVTGLTGKELGKFLGYCKKDFPAYYVQEATVDDIKNKIQVIYELYTSI